MEEKVSKSSGFIFIALVMIISLTFDLLVYFFPGFWNHNSEYQWSVLWHGRGLWAFGVWLFWSGVLILTYGLWQGLSRRFSGSGFNFLAGILIFLLGLLSPIAFTQIDRYGRYELLIRVFVPDHTSYFTDAKKFRNKDELIKIYLNNWASLNTHSRTHPPGTILVFMGLNQMAESSGLVQGFYQFLVKPFARREMEKHFQVNLAQQAGGMLALILMILSGAISAGLGYFILRKFYPPELCFICSLALVSLPAFSHKAPVMDYVYATFILGSSLIALLSLTQRFWLKTVCLAIAGFLIGAGLWLSPSVWSAVLLALILIFLKEKTAHTEPEFFKTLKNTLLAGLLMGIGILMALWLGGKLIGVSWLEIHKINRLGWHFNNTISGRINPWKWMVFNPYEFFLWLSLPITIGFIGKLWFEIKKIKDKNFWAKIDPFFWFLLIFLLILNISGQVCYESPRLCWFCLGLVSAMGVQGAVLAMKNLHTWAILMFFSLISLQTMFFRLIY